MFGSNACDVDNVVICYLGTSAIIRKFHVLLFVLFTCVSSFFSLVYVLSFRYRIACVSLRLPMIIARELFVCPQNTTGLYLLFFCGAMLAERCAKPLVWVDFHVRYE